MIQQISYKHCTCDFCGKTEDIEDPLLKPKNWVNVEIYSKYLACQSCCKKIDIFIRTELNGNLI